MKMRRWTSILLAILLAIALLPVNCTTVLAEGDSLIKLNRTEVALVKGKTFALKVNFTESVPNRTIQWSSSSPSVATVNRNGIIRAVGGGTAIIAARSVYGAEARALVTVNVKPTKVSMPKRGMTLYTGDTYQATARVYPSDATDKTVTFRSSRPAVATVDENGKIVALGKGSTVIRAYTSNGKSASMTVTVKVAPVGVTLNKTEMKLYKGKRFTLKASVTPANAYSKTIRWSSNNTFAATVNSRGQITARNAGTAVITARSVNGLTATCEIKVEVPISRLRISPSFIQLPVGGAGYKLTASVSPEAATDKKLTWSSSDERVAAVDQNGSVTPVAAGSAVIWAKADSGAKASVKVSVVTPATGIQINQKEISVAVGKSVNLTAAVTPAEAGDKSVSWRSSDKRIAVVLPSGKVMGKSAGECEVIATANGGTSVTASCKVTVTGTADKVIALTFDDGPNANTLSILSTLNEYGVKATFFMLGSSVNANPAIAKQVAAFGHEIGNHSYSHGNLLRMSAYSAKKDIERADAAIRRATGVKPKLIRAPGGSIRASLAKSIGRPFVQWNIDTLDWKYRNSGYVYNQVIGKARDKTIVLMHDIRPTTAAAVKNIVPKLLEQGYRFVTVSELMDITGHHSNTLIYKP